MSKAQQGLSSLKLFSVLISKLMIVLTSLTASAVVFVDPPVLIVTELGRPAVFTCTSRVATIVDVEWLINGTSLNNLQLNDVNNQRFVVTLEFQNVRKEYNNTRIQCIANTTTHGVVATGNSTLIIQGPQVEMVICIHATQYIIIMSAPVSSGQLTLVDIDTGETITLVDTDLSVTGTNITFTSQQLRQNRRYTLIVMASNAVGSATSEYGQIISTHDITGCSVSEEIGHINISAFFAQGSNATGALFTFISMNHINFREASYQVFNRSDVSQGLLLPLEMLHLDLYMVYAYDIEHDKELQDGIGYPACNLNNVAINGARNSSVPLSDSCNATSLAGLITVTCLFAKYQLTVQISDPDRTSILYINTTTETQTPVTVQVMEIGEYLVTVLPIQDGMGILSGMEFLQIIHMVDDAPTTQAPTSAMPTTSISATSGTTASPISPMSTTATATSVTEGTTLSATSAATTIVAGTLPPIFLLWSKAF